MAQMNSIRNATGFMRQIKYDTGINITKMGENRPIHIKLNLTFEISFLFATYEPVPNVRAIRTTLFRVRVFAETVCNDSGRTDL